MKAPSTIALALLLPASLVAQAAPTKDQVVGTWTTVVNARTSNGKPTQYDLTLRADGGFLFELKTIPSDVGLPSMAPADDSVTGPVDITRGTSKWTQSTQEWGRWSLVGDSLRFGRDGQYTKYRVRVQGPELTLQQAFNAYTDKDNTVIDKGHHTECNVWVFTRVAPAQPLPAPAPRTCQQVAGPLPKPALKAADLLGTWDVVDGGYFVVQNASSSAAIRGVAQRVPDAALCSADFASCEVRMDTLTLRADSTLEQHMIRNAARLAIATGYKIDTTTVKAIVKLRWWLASDTLWAAPMTEPEKKAAIATLSLEDNGRYLIYTNSLTPALYQRAKP